MQPPIDKHRAADYIRTDGEPDGHGPKRRVPILIPIDVSELTNDQQAKVLMAISRMMRKAGQLGKTQLITLLLEPDGSIGFTESNSIVNVKRK